MFENAFLNDVLAAYERESSRELSIDRLGTFLEMKYGTLGEGKAALGGALWRRSSRRSPGCSGFCIGIDVAWGAVPTCGRSLPAPHSPSNPSWFP
jgi:hypothetical protein